MPELAALDLGEAVAKVGNHWAALRGGHVFITGSTGFIGTWLLETFVRANTAWRLNAHATVLTRDPEAFRAKAPHLASRHCIHLSTGDVRFSDFPQAGFSHVIHAAADASRAAGEAASTFDTIVCGTRRVLAFCRHTGIPNLLFLSSGAVYGPQPADIPLLPEDFVGGASSILSPYAQAKRKAESLCTACAAETGLRIVTARCFAFLGPHLPFDGPFAAGNFIGDAIRGRPIEVRGDGRTVRSYLYAADLAAWLWTMALSTKATGTYNVGSDQQVTIAELAKAVAAAANVPLHFAVTPAGGESRYVPSVARARAELGLDVEVSVKDAIDRTLRWYAKRTIIGESLPQKLQAR